MTPETFAWSSASVQPGRRGTLTRRRVLDAAVEVIDVAGVRGFTMARGADRVGVQAMALYRYFPSREHLLDGVIDRAADDLYNAPQINLATQDWRDLLFTIGHLVRRAALAHPQLFPLTATKGPATPDAWPPLSTLRWSQGFTATLRRCGFDTPAARLAYREFCRFLIGHLLLETLPRPPEQPPPRPAGRQQPTTTPHTATDPPDQEFQHCLSTTIDRIALMKTTTATVRLVE